MISVDEALRNVLGAVGKIEAEEIDLKDALGRTLAEDVVSKDDIPFCDNSAMDGYAVRRADVASATEESPVVLDVIEDLPAGKAPEQKITPGKAAKIMTGAPIPDGADAVVMVEDTRLSGEKVSVLAPPERSNIRPRGEDIAKGSVVVEAGALLRPQELGLLASVGCARLKVSRRPRVAVLSTGDEVVECAQPLEIGKVRNSNAYSLMGLIRDAGAMPYNLGIAHDTRQALISRLKAGMNADILVTSGGVSVGEYDFVKDALEEMGMTLKHWKVAMKPGMPSLFGTMGKRLVFGLPGNPVSVIVCFEQFARPAILKMLGRKQVLRPVVKATMDEDLKHKGERRTFVCAEVRVVDGAYRARVRGPQGSGILRSMGLANALIVLPEDSPSPRKGDQVSVQLLDLPQAE